CVSAAEAESAKNRPGHFPPALLQAGASEPYQSYRLTLRTLPSSAERVTVRQPPNLPARKRNCDLGSAAHAIRVAQCQRRRRRVLCTRPEPEWARDWPGLLHHASRSGRSLERANGLEPLSLTRGVPFPIDDRAPSHLLPHHDFPRCSRIA